MDEIGDRIGLLAMAMNARHLAYMGASAEAIVRTVLGRTDVLVAALEMQATRWERERREVHTTIMRRLESALDLAAGEVFRATFHAVVADVT